jgi:hypothetical protein
VGIVKATTKEDASMPGYIAAAGSIVRMRKQFGDGFEEKFSARARRVPSGKLGEPMGRGLCRFISSVR